MTQKLLLNFIKKRNAYLQIDLAFAIAIFFVFSFFVYSFYDSYYNSQLGSIEEFEVIANSRDICYVLTRSQGVPSNWETNLNSMQMIGIKNLTSDTLDPDKIAVFIDSNYFQILDSLELGNMYFKLDIFGLETNTSYLDFGANSNLSNYVSKSSCYSNYNGEIVKVTAEVWK